jgi:exonuclease VII small subunit
LNNDTRTSWPYLLVNVDFIGTCHGTCRGCLLTDDERLNSSPFLSYEKILKSLESLKEKTGDINLDYSALAFGRGNTLAMDAQQWKIVQKSSERLKHLFNPKKFTLECSTGLIGKVDGLIYQAKKQVDFIGNELRFVVAANSDLFSPKYWDNVDSFFESMMSFRGGSSVDGSGDVLLLNLVADRLPNANELLKRIADYPFPINIALLPATHESSVITLKAWLNEFYTCMKDRKFDSNLVSFIDSDNQINLHDALIDFSDNSSRFWWINKNGELTRGVFTPFGDVDYIRLNAKNSLNYPSNIFNNATEVLKQIRKMPSCTNCVNLNKCISSGSIALALASHKSKHCPLGLR